MTAEVAVLNSAGIALAADSAITLGSGDEGKIWTSAEKLFQLSEADPVAFMFYNNATVGGLPWEVVVREYRRRFGSVSRSTVEEHAEAFLRFVATSHRAVPPNWRSNTLLANMRDLVQLTLAQLSDISERAKSGGAPVTAEDLLRSWISGFPAEPSAVWVDSDWQLEGGEVSRELPQDVVSSLDQALEDESARLEQVDDERGRQLLRECLIKSVQHFHAGDVQPTHAGIVIAGFGSESLTPSLVQLSVDLLGEGHLRASCENKRYAVAPETRSLLVPFAQSEAVHSFLTGLHPGLQSVINRDLNDTHRALCAAVLEQLQQFGVEVDSEGRTAFENLFNTASRTFADGVAQLSKRLYGPVMDAMAWFPKEELAAAAEAFVNLSKFKVRTGLGRDTVGGPIDVAVITRGEGFVWTSRKHYFSPDLNPRVIRSYGSNAPRFSDGGADVET